MKRNRAAWIAATLGTAIVLAIPLLAGKEPASEAPTKAADWQQAELIDLTIRQLEIDVKSAYLNDPSSFDKILKTLAQSQETVNELSQILCKPRCMPPNIYCCCGACKAVCDFSRPCAD